MAETANNILQYKGQPMVRCGNKIYYGDPAQRAILVLTVLESKSVDGEDVPSRVLVQIQSTDPALELSPAKILKESEKSTLVDALEIGTIWLQRELK
ncbi:MAG: hypothetical protein IKV98_03310 [Clostridia bacterium]|jgi:hypothetical protein|nr:hypothetical protein [Clostridia bacterium]